MKIIKKRNGQRVELSLQTIYDAIMGAFLEVSETYKDDTQVFEISSDIHEIILQSDIEYDVDAIQDLIEETLSTTMPAVAKKYILYRNRKDKERKFKKKYLYLTDSFLKQYKHRIPPLTHIGMFTFLRTYSRFINELGRRESYLETVARTVDENIKLQKYAPKQMTAMDFEISKKEAEDLFDNVFNARQFLSGRAMWTSGNGVSEKHPISQYNCSFMTIKSYNDFKELCYLLMLGCGVGIGIYKDEVAKLKPLRHVTVKHNYVQLPKHQRQEHSTFSVEDDIMVIRVGDSKNGWMESIEYYFDARTKDNFRDIKYVVLDYSSVRPFGEPLKTFGGFASGHMALQQIFEKIDNIPNSKLTPLNCLDIATSIGEGIVVGGTRRSALISLVDSDDEETIDCKSNLYSLDDTGKWVIDNNISHRTMSNNTIVYEAKPTREQLNDHIDRIRYSGEPGFYNAEEARRRFPSFKGTNPCGEILLSDKMFCNLTTVNMMGFVDEDGNIDLSGLIRAQILSAKASYRVTLPSLELYEWDKKQKEHRLTGCSLTGVQDFINKTGISDSKFNALLETLRYTASFANTKYAEFLGTNPSDLVTTVKPEGTLSLLPTVSSGLHWSHSPYYIRRIRINSQDPLCKLAEKLNYPIYPENGQEMETAKTKVVEFVVKSPEGRTKSEVGAIEQLEFYKRMMHHYVDHNASITVHVRENEWDDVKEWVWTNWDSVVGISFLAFDDSFYQLLPYESITKQEYDERIKTQKRFDVNELASFEQTYEEYELEAECSSGSCPIR